MAAAVDEFCTGRIHQGFCWSHFFPTSAAKARHDITAPAERSSRKTCHGLQIAEILVIAHVQAAGIAQRLMVPGRVASAAQGLIYLMSLPLTRNDGGMQRRQVPAPAGLGAEL